MTPTDEIAFREYQTHRQMADALNTVKDLRDLRDVRIALRHAGYEDDTIDQHMHGALEIAQDRAFLKRWVNAMGEVACLSGFLGSLYLIFAPDHAMAMDGREIAAWALVGVIGIVTGFVLIAAFVAHIVSIIRGPEPDDEEAHGDLTGYGRDPKGRF